MLILKVDKIGLIVGGDLEYECIASMVLNI